MILLPTLLSTAVALTAALAPLPPSLPGRYSGETLDPFAVDSLGRISRLGGERYASESYWVVPGGDTLLWITRDHDRIDTTRCRYRQTAAGVELRVGSSQYSRPQQLLRLPGPVLSARQLRAGVQGTWRRSDDGAGLATSNYLRFCGDTLSRFADSIQQSVEPLAFRRGVIVFPGGVPVVAGVQADTLVLWGERYLRTAEPLRQEPLTKTITDEVTGLSIHRMIGADSAKGLLRSALAAFDRESPEPTFTVPDTELGLITILDRGYSSVYEALTWRNYAALPATVRPVFTFAFESDEGTPVLLVQRQGALISTDIVAVEARRSLTGENAGAVDFVLTLTPAGAARLRRATMHCPVQMTILANTRCVSALRFDEPFSGEQLLLPTDEYGPLTGAWQRFSQPPQPQSDPQIK